jgi:hypothetical protein
VKKLVGLSAAALMGVSLVAGASSAAPKQQTVEGSVKMMAPWAGTQLATCYSGGHRRLAILTSENQAINGVIGYHFDLDPATVNKPFTLEVTGGSADVDLDITFYPEFGTPEQAADPNYAPAAYSYEQREAGGEAGKVPPGMKKAIVCMHTGTDATFTYTAGKGVKAPQ